MLLPSDYYEASLLQIRVTEPCTHPRPASAKQSVDKLQCKPVPWFVFVIILHLKTIIILCFVCFVLCKLLALSAFAPGQIFLCPWFRGSAFQARGRIQKNTCATASSQSASDGPNQWKRGQILLIAVPSVLLTINLPD